MEFLFCNQSGYHSFIGRCKKTKITSGDLALEDLAKYGYQPNMKYKSLIISLYRLILTHLNKPNYRNMARFAIIFSLASGHCKLLKTHLTFQVFSFFILL
jgi:hypothetical protein